jgi:hypothetical protein
VHARQIRLAEQLARRQFIVTGDTGAAAPAANGRGSPEAAVGEVEAAVGLGPAPPVVIDGLDTLFEVVLIAGRCGQLLAGRPGGSQVGELAGSVGEHAPASWPSSRRMPTHP